MNSRLLALAIAAVLSAATQARATFLVGTSPNPDTNPSLAGGSVIDFDSAPTGSFSSLTIGNVTFGEVGDDFTIGNAFIGQFNNYGTQSLYNPNTDSNDNFDLTSFTFQFSSPVSAFGFNSGASNSDWTLSAYSSSHTLIESDVLPQTEFDNGGDYFGIAAPDISFVTLTEDPNYTAGDYIFIDNFTTVAGSVVAPAPDTASTALLLILGLVAVVGASHRRHVSLT
jgi:hypothetical protein